MALRPPDLSKREPLVEPWPARVPIFRVHRAAYRPDQFNATWSSSRFRPFKSGSRIVATAYGAGDLAGAFSESIFHDLSPDAGEQIVLRSTLYGYVRSIVAPTRDLTLVSLRGAGLRRLRTTAAALIHSDHRAYPETAAYAAALYRWKRRPDGLIWDSRLHPGTPAVMLFGTRVKPGALEFSFDAVEPLWKGTGLEEVLLAAEAAGITIVL